MIVVLRINNTEVMEILSDNITLIKEDNIVVNIKVNNEWLKDHCNVYLDKILKVTSLSLTYNNGDYIIISTDFTLIKSIKEGE